MVKNLYTILTFTLLLLPAFVTAQDTVLTDANETFQGHTDDVTCIAFSYDGKTIATGSWDKRILIWDAEEMTVKTELKGHSTAILALSFSRNSQNLLSTANDGTAMLWDIEAGTKSAAFYGNTVPLSGGALSPDPGSRFLATGGEEGVVKVYDRSKKNELVRSFLVNSPVYGLVFDNTGRNVFIASKDNTIRMYDHIQNTVKMTYEGHKSRVNAVAITIDGKYMITGSDDKTAIIWNTKTGEALHTLEGHTWKVLSVGFNPRGEYAVTSSNDGTARVWNVETGEEMIQMKPSQRDVISQAVFSPDSRFVFTTSLVKNPDDDAIKKWETNLIKENTQADGAKGAKKVIKLGPDGKPLPASHPAE
ncbi:MAG: WD40 repeat domain-containing protein [Bacteroidia bacterium]